MSIKRLSQFCGRAMVVSLMVGCAIIFLSLKSASAQPASLFDDGYYCPASQHSCGVYGTEAYFAPDPFDVGAGCDSNFLRYTNDPQFDQDGNGIHDSSCYGGCDLACNTPGGTCDYFCYANCQSGNDGMGGYAGCLRGAFGIGPRPTPFGGSGDPTVPRNISGNIYRNCLVGLIPGIYQAEYDSCIGSGGTVEDCCTVVANHFP